MKISLSFAFVTMIAVQAVHAVEEFVFEFWNVFPPMRAVYGGTPGLGECVFIAFHAMIIGMGVWCYRRWVRGGGKNAMTVVRAGMAVQSITVLLHAAWFLTAPGYQPGLATTPLFLPAIALGWVALRNSESEALSGNA
jgi:hypothetical protein